MAFAVERKRTHFNKGKLGSDVLRFRKCKFWARFFFFLEGQAEAHTQVND